MLDGVTSGDFDGDENLDLATVTPLSNNVSVQLGNGDGTFAEPQQFAVGVSPVSVISGHFNDDNFLDLATANSGSNDVSVRLGNGDGTFADPQLFAVGVSPVSVISGHFNDDNGDRVIDDDDFLDLATANSGSNDVSVLLGKGDGNFDNLRPFTFGLDVSPKSLTSGDFDGDGLLDLATANSDGTVSVLLQRDGRLAVLPPFEIGGSSPVSVISGHFNDDNGVIDDDDFLDLATANADSDNVSVLLGKGDGTFHEPKEFAVGEAPASVAPASVISGHFNDDKFLDLATANAGTSNDTGNVSVLLGKGDGTFGLPKDIDLISPTSVISGHFNDDNHLDLATSLQTFDAGANQVSVLKGRGDGRFFLGADTDVPVVTFEHFDADQFLDVAFANSDENFVLVAYGQPPDGLTFASRSARVSVGLTPTSIVAGQFNDDNGDGVIDDKDFLDLATANKTRQSVTLVFLDEMGIVKSTSDLPFNLVGGPVSITSGQFSDDNGDGVIDDKDFLDLATANEATDLVAVLLGPLDGRIALRTFSVDGDSPMKFSPVSLISGHFDGDKFLDLATVNSGSDNVSVLLGQGNGTFIVTRDDFGNPIWPKVGDFPVFGIVGDFDGDGLDDDLATVNRDSNDVSVLLGQGDGTFIVPKDENGNPISSKVANSPVFGIVGDFDGDGSEDDLAIMNSVGAQVLSGNGDGTFFFPELQPPLRPKLGRSELALIGDFNGDGQLEWFIINQDTGGGILVTDSVDASTIAQPAVGAIALQITPSSLVVTENRLRTNTTTNSNSGASSTSSGGTSTSVASGLAAPDIDAGFEQPTLVGDSQAIELVALDLREFTTPPASPKKAEDLEPAEAPNQPTSDASIATQQQTGDPWQESESESIAGLADAPAGDRRTGEESWGPIAGVFGGVGAALLMFLWAKRRRRRNVASDPAAPLAPPETRSFEEEQQSV